MAKRWLSLGIAAGVAVAAGGGVAVARHGHGDVDVAGQWRLTGIEVTGHPAALQGQQATLELTTRYAQYLARGSDGCNDYGGDAWLDGDRITFGSIYSTRMLCAPARTALASAVEAGLAAADRVERHGDTLVLTGDGASLTFTRLSA